MGWKPLPAESLDLKYRIALVRRARDRAIVPGNKENDGVTDRVRSHDLVLHERIGGTRKANHQLGLPEQRDDRLKSSSGARRFRQRERERRGTDILRERPATARQYRFAID